MLSFPKQGPQARQRGRFELGRAESAAANLPPKSRRTIARPKSEQHAQPRRRAKQRVTGLNANCVEQVHAGSATLFALPALWHGLPGAGTGRSFVFSVFHASPRVAAQNPGEYYGTLPTALDQLRRRSASRCRTEQLNDPLGRKRLLLTPFRNTDLRKYSSDFLSARGESVLILPRGMTQWRRGPSAGRSGFGGPAG